MHIHQIGTSGVAYTIVEAEGDLETHPSIIEHPELFEILDTKLPDVYQKLQYGFIPDPIDEINEKISILEAEIDLLKQ